MPAETRPKQFHKQFHNFTQPLSPVHGQTDTELESMGETEIFSVRRLDDKESSTFPVVSHVLSTADLHVLANDAWFENQRSKMCYSLKRNVFTPGLLLLKATTEPMPRTKK